MSNDITLDVAGAKVTLPAATMAALWLDRVRAEAAPVAKRAPSGPPAIGEPWAAAGGTYAGVCSGRAGAPDYYLIVHDEQAANIVWEAAKEWAEGLRAGGLADYALPTRAEQAVLYGNVPELFAKEWYWSGEQSAGDEEFAWGQYFYGGHQGSYLKSAPLRARAVRRAPIE